MKSLNNELQECIDNCNACVTATKICVDQHIGEKEMEKCLKLSLDCTDLVSACAKMLAAQSDYVKRVCGVCADLCNECADECDKFDSEVCKHVHKNVGSVQKAVPAWRLNNAIKALEYLQIHSAGIPMLMLVYFQE